MSGPISPAMAIAGRDLTEPKLDPTGRWLAFVARRGRTASIVVVDLDAARPIERELTTHPPPAPGRGRGGGCYAWLADGSGVVYAAADGGLWSQPLGPGGADILVAAEDDHRLEAPAAAPDGSVVYVRDQAQVWRLPAGASRPGRVDHGEHEFCLDPAVAPDGTSVSYQAWSPPDMPWDGAVIVTVDLATGARSISGDDDVAWQQPRFAPDGTLVAVHDRTGWLNVHWDGRPLVAGGDRCEHAEPTWGPGQASFAIAPGGDHVAIARNEHGFGRLVVVDVATGSPRDVARGVHGALSWSGHRVAALRSGARTPTQVVVYDATTWDRTVVAVGPVVGWDGAALVEPELLTVAHDGAELHARLYRSPRPSDRLLCWIHGGPTGQWPVEFNARIAHWVDRGWHVLVPDHRGSTGHGRAYQQALHRRWGELDVEDTAAVLAHAHHSGVGRPTSTVVMGGSSGGSTVLGVVTGPHAALVAGGVAAYPVTELVELAERSHRFEAHYTDTLVAPRDDVDVLRARSMARRAGDLARPLLLLHGTEDPVVPFEGTVAFADAARQAGADVELHVFEGEGHGFADPANQLREYDLIARFLARVVPEPVGA